MRVAHQQIHHRGETVVLNLPETVMLAVSEGKCGCLRPTNRVIAVPKGAIPGDDSCWSLQVSKFDGAFWLIYNGWRYRGKCFCTKCNQVFNGDGGNLRKHFTSHKDGPMWTREQQERAFFMFLINHHIGFTALRDVLTTIFLPGVSYVHFMEMLHTTADAVNQRITAILKDKDLSLMIDGWSDSSLRRYLGIGACYYDYQSGRQCFRLLKLHYDSQGHSAAHQTDVLRACMDSFQVTGRRMDCLCSDSAQVNTAIADRMNLQWMPCCCHLWNLIIRNFVQNCPLQLQAMLENINSLRKKTLWVEFLASNMVSPRNIRGYVPTRWGSICDCVNSFWEMKDQVQRYQQVYKCTLFTDEDIEFLDSVRCLFSRFLEVTDLLMDADNREGLATVFETMNAVYMMVTSNNREDSPLKEALDQMACEIRNRFFWGGSKFCCRVLFAGVLNVAHGMPPWLMARLPEILGQMAEEAELFTGGTPPGSPQERATDRYSEQNSLMNMIDGSSASSERNSDILDEIHNFIAKRDTFEKIPFSAFWRSCPRYPHLQMLAGLLRRLPTTTIRLEGMFSVSRRILSWTRMRLSPITAGEICLVSANKDLAQQILNIDPDMVERVIDENQGVPTEVDDEDVLYIMDDEE